MAPFIQLPIVIANSEGESKEVLARILPGEIDYYYPGLHEGTVVVTKSRSSYLTLLPPEQFDNVLVTYEQFKKANAGKFGVLNYDQPKPKLHVSH
jgi:hypothetical protein